MKLFFPALLLCMAALTTQPAQAIDCTQATMPLDRTICGSETLLQQDAELNRLYASVKQSVAPPLHTKFTAQQRDWLKQRAQVCKTAETPCIDAAGKHRLAQLQALAATAASQDDKLADLTPVYLSGIWKATTIGDPAYQGAEDSTVVNGHLIDAGLPPLNTLIDTGPGKLCYKDGSNHCQELGWSLTTIDKVDGGPSMMRDFGWPATTPAYIGSTGGKRSYFLLVPNGPKDLSAIFILCSAHDENCRNAYQVWSPVSADAVMVPR